jgi:hypothetical protein
VSDNKNCSRDNGQRMLFGGHESAAGGREVAGFVESIPVGPVDNQPLSTGRLCS